MKASDLKEAQRLVDARDQHRRLLERLTAGEGVHVILGDGALASEIVLAERYLNGLKADIGTALAKKIDRYESALDAMGVET